MLSHPMSRSEPSANDSPSLPQSDLARLLEHHVLAGFPPDLALDLVLNELVVRAASVTHASAAALALMRGEEMVCRAATGLHAPDLGIPLNTRDGLSGACVRSRAPQLCIDTESDPRVDPAISRILGIRSMLIVPVFDAVPDLVIDDEAEAKLHSRFDPGLHGTNSVSEIHPPQLTGVLEVFAPLPNAFSQTTQSLLEKFADECARICHAAVHLRTRPTAVSVARDEKPILPDVEPLGGEPDLVLSPAELSRRATDLILPESPAADSPAAHEHVRQPYEVWTLVLGGLAILAAAAVSFLIGTRVGWIPQSAPLTTQSASASAASSTAAAPADSPQTKPAPKTSAKPPNAAAAGSADELVVYEKGKVIFRVKPAPSTGAATAKNSMTDRAAVGAAPIVRSSSRPNGSPHPVWLGPAQAESLLLNRVEPEYPADALAARRAGDVTLEVRVAEDGTVSSVRTLSGDPLLAAAATEAVRSWRYQPYRIQDQAAPFQTDVTLTFTLPN